MTSAEALLWRLRKPTPRRNGRRPICRPMLERLEDRLAPALLTDPNLVLSVPSVTKPGFLTPVTDAVFGTQFTRIAGNAGTSFTATAGGTGTWSYDARHMYSK